MPRIVRRLLVCVALVLGASTLAHGADRTLQVRVSFKRIASPSGERSWWSDDRIADVTRGANRVLSRAGFRMRIAEVVDVQDPGIPAAWFDTLSEHYFELEDAARTGDVDMTWRTDAVNVFLVGSIDFGSFSGLCFTPPGPGAVFVAEQPGGPGSPQHLVGTLAHEIGHYMGLLHTFDSGYPDPSARCSIRPSDCARTGDYVCDTAPDPNDLGVLEDLYGSCGERGRRAAANLRNNVMSYYSHGISRPPQFTRGQARRMRAFGTTFRPEVIEPTRARPGTAR